jgi:hypothetical protein
MASTTQVIVTTTDDIDGTTNAKTVKFGLDDKQYSIDLNPEHEAQLRAALALYIGHAKVVTTKQPAARRGTRSTSRSIEVREWARRQGMDIPQRGRISQTIIDAYNAAHAAPAPAPVVAPAPLAFEPAPAPLA